MWKLKVAGGDDPWLRTLKGHVGRQVWEFDPHLGTQEERNQVDEARRSFADLRFEKKHSSDLLMRMQARNLLYFVLLVTELTFFFFFLGKCFPEKKIECIGKLVVELWLFLGLFFGDSTRKKGEFGNSKNGWFFFFFFLGKYLKFV